MTRPLREERSLERMLLLAARPPHALCIDVVNEAVQPLEPAQGALVLEVRPLGRVAQRGASLQSKSMRSLEQGAADTHTMVI